MNDTSCMMLYIYYFGLPQNSPYHEDESYDVSDCYMVQQSYDGLRNDKVTMFQILVWCCSIDYQYQCRRQYQRRQYQCCCHFRVLLGTNYIMFTIMNTSLLLI